MVYIGKGFSNIRVVKNQYSYSASNTFPEEVFMHEFLHSLERTAEEYGYTIPALHDYEKYGYKNQDLTGLKDWYKDYINNNIKTSSGYTGLPEKVFTLKPAKNLDFKYSYKIDEFHEPQNIIEQIEQLFKNVIYNLKNIRKSE